MSETLDRRQAVRMGLLATIGAAVLPGRAEASVGAPSENEAVVGRWFTEFWGKTYNPRHGRDDIAAFMHDFRAAFPDLNFWGTAPLLTAGDYVIGQWEGGGTHTGPAFSDFLMGALPANSGRTMHFTGITILKLKDGKILQEVGLDDGVTALTQLGLLVKRS